jgi:hypothetical protein
MPSQLPLLDHWPDCSYQHKPADGVCTQNVPERQPPPIILNHAKLAQPILPLLHLHPMHNATVPQPRLLLYIAACRDFQLPSVVSINASGHKFGLVYPGLGWVMWRSRQYLPESLVRPADVGTVAGVAMQLRGTKPSSLWQLQTRHHSLNGKVNLFLSHRYGFSQIKAINRSSNVPDCCACRCSMTTTWARTRSRSRSTSARAP